MATLKKTEESLAKIIKEYIIPSTVGNDGKVLTTVDGVNISWEGIDTLLPTQSSTTANKVLVSDGTTVSWKSISMKNFTIYGTENQTTISTASYNITSFMQMDVFKDGIKLIEGVDNDFTFDQDTNTITLSTPLFDTDIIVLVFLVFE